MLDRQCPVCGYVPPEPKPLTRIQHNILDYLRGYNAEHGYMPTFEDICAHFGYTSLATVHEHLTNLARKGHIRRTYNEARAIVITSDA